MKADKFLRGRPSRTGLVTLFFLWMSICPAWCILTKALATADSIAGLSGVSVDRVVEAAVFDGDGVVGRVGLFGTGVTSANREAIVSVLPGQPVRLLLRKGDPVTALGLPPGYTLDSFMTDSPPPLHVSANGVLARLVLLRQGGLNDVYAIMAGTPNDMSVQIYQYQAVPEMGANMKAGAPGHARINRAGQITFNVSYGNGIGGGFAAIRRGAPGSFTTVAQTGVKYAGLPGEGKFASLQSPAILDSGDVVFGGVLVTDVDNVVTTGNQNRFWKSGPPFIQEFSETQTVPDGGRLRNAVPHYGAGVNRQRAVLLVDNPPVTLPGQYAVAMYQPDGFPKIMFRTGQEAPDTGGAVFATSSLTSIRILPSGPAAVSASLQTGGSVTSANSRGVWRWDGSQLRLLARKGIRHSQFGGEDVDGSARWGRPTQWAGGFFR